MYNIKKITVKKKSFKVNFINYATMTLENKTFSEQKHLYVNVISDKDLKKFKGARVDEIEIEKNEDKHRLFKIKTSKGDFSVEFKEKLES